MRLGDGEGQRVVAGVATLRTGQVLRPGLDLGRPERVSGRPDLQDDRVVVLTDRVVEPADQLGLLLRGAQTGLDRKSVV